MTRCVRRATGAAMVGRPFHKGLSLTPTMATSPPASQELQYHPLTLRRQILQLAIVPAVTRLRPRAAVWAPLIAFANRWDYEN
jgi:hypothetical protein